MSNSKKKFNRSSINLVIFVLSFSILLCGCYKVRFYHDTDKLREFPDAEISATSSIISFSKVDEPAQIRSACPSGASFIEIEQTMFDGLTNYLSLGFYSQQTIRVWCKRRKRQK